jgi:hypothetical protein
MGFKKEIIVGNRGETNIEFHLVKGLRDKEEEGNIITKGQDIDWVKGKALQSHYPCQHTQKSSLQNFSVLVGQ